MPVNKKQAAVGGGAALTAMAAILLPYTSHWEGTRLIPYRDLGGVMTVCTGETRVQMRRYTPAECKAMLQRALKDEYGPKVLACVPGIDRNIFAFAALTDAAYNAGPAAACRSPMARAFRVGNWRAGCAAFKGWYDTVKGLSVKGLRNRRVEDKTWSETALCRKGL